MAGTAQQYIAQLNARIGKPYSEVIDGGVGPNYYDCSGLVMVCLNAIGIPFTRTTYSQWADQRFQHFGPFGYGAALPPMQLGDVLYMHVAGEADPGHVGTYDGVGGLYLDAPHTGAFVRIELIPNTPSEHVYGIIRPPFGAPVPVPPPPAPPIPPPPPITPGVDMADGPTVIDISPEDGNRHVYVYNEAQNVTYHYWQNPKGQPNFDWYSEKLPNPA